MNRNALRGPLAPGVLVTSVALGLTLWAPTLAQAATTPTPAALIVKSTTTTSAAMDWKKVAGASGYRVRYATASNMAGAKGAAFKYSNGTITGLRPGTKYWFRIAVAAKNGTGAAQSAYTKAPYVTGTTKASAAPPPPPPPRTGEPTDVNVVTWNIGGIQSDSQAGRAGKEQQKWVYREPVIVQEMLGLAPGDQRGPAPDVVNLQEANNYFAFNGSTQYQDLVKKLNASAPGGNHYATIGAGNGSMESAATRIAYNDSTLTLVSSGVLRWASQDNCDGDRYMPWAIFEIKATHSRFFDSSNHLESCGTAARQKQWNQLRTAAPQLAGGLPIITSGDFNTTRGNPSTNYPRNLAGMRTSGFGDVMGQQDNSYAYSSNARARSVFNGNFNSANKYVRSLAPYANTDMVGQSIDYIFATNSLAVKKWEVVLNRTDTASGGRYNLIGTIPSDHNMIRATITIP